MIGNQGRMFSAGADLPPCSSGRKRQDWTAIDATLRRAQGVMMALKYAPVPIVAAPFGKVLGGGLEVVLHIHRVQAALETTMGLVETSVGVIPGAGASRRCCCGPCARPAKLGPTCRCWSGLRDHRHGQDQRLGLGCLRPRLYLRPGTA